VNATPARDPASLEALGGALSMLVTAADVVEPHRLIDLVGRAAALLGASSADIWLADHQQRTLVRLAGSDSREQQPIEGSMVGRAYISSEVVQVEEDGTTRLWVPLLAGVERTGVIELEVASAAPDVDALCEFAAAVATQLVISDQYTDLYTQTRRQQPMTLAAELQWTTLPPASFATKDVHVAGMLEPAYEVGGDTFDYAHGDGRLSFAILDAVGHSLDSSIISSLALGAYRNGRRNDRSLLELAAAMDAVIEEHLGGSRYATGQLATLDTVDGTLHWLNAGHPLPLLIRRGQVIGHLACAPRPPFGLHRLVPRLQTEIATTQLEPGDAVLLYSDGVIERRSPEGADYGIDRLEEFLHRAFAAETTPAETLRRLSNSILDFHGGDLQDDATTILVVWQDARTPANGTGTGTGTGT
jgi:serine phosphatase RsbU (regulator of sigma subunit)